MDELRDQLLAFAAHIRDPEHFAAPDGIEDRRMAVYRDLFFNSLESLLAGNFPVIRRTLGEDAWRELVRAFYATHRCTTPLFTRIASEFADWLGVDAPDGPEWLPELAQYEYVELALAISEEAAPPHDPNGDVVDGIPVASPQAWPLAYAWPVHRIGPGHVPTEPGPQLTLLLARRDADGEVRFAELSPLAFRLLLAIDQNDAGHGGLQLLRGLLDDLPVDDPDAFLAGGTDMLHRLRAEGVLIGTR